MTAGKLKDRVRFLRRALDENNDRLGAWEPEGIAMAARIVAWRGGEAVTASRLGGVQPYEIRVRASSWTRTLTTDFKVQNVRTRQEYNIRAVATDETGAWVDMMTESGTAEG